MEKDNRDYHRFIKLYSQFKDVRLWGRYITYSHIKESIEELQRSFDIEEIDKSTLGVPINSITLGRGKIKILAWSQMHGNESTTTKTIFDLCKAFNLYKTDPFIENLLDTITIKIIPMLNPDGALAYTRVNANDVDLNRDAHLLKEVESKILREVFNKFEPHFCLNLHDQRTIFSAGNKACPATVSFLTPAMDPQRAITPSRERSMKVIAAINEDLQVKIPGQIGRYNDTYNINCTGDTFQTLNIPTILFEAGHFKNDYHRETTREFVTYALFSALDAIASERWQKYSTQEYLKIPQNQKLFYDAILRDAKVEGKILDIAIQFKEELSDGAIQFIPVVQKIGRTLADFGHKEIDCKEMEVAHEDLKNLTENDIVRKVLLKNEVLIVENINY